MKITEDPELLKGLNRHPPVFRPSPSPDDVSFLLCIGDGRTDEVVFTQLKEIDIGGLDTPTLSSLGVPMEYGKCLTVTVGKKESQARFYLEDVREVEKLLRDLASLSDTVSLSSRPDTKTIVGFPTFARISPSYITSK